MSSVTLRKPDDFHLHLREGKLLEAVLPHSAQTFARTLVMPNLANPIRNARQAQAYKKIILQTRQQSQSLPNTPSPFQPLMTLFLTEETTLQDFLLDDAEHTLPPLEPPLERSVFAGKLYFATATTNTRHGVKNLSQLFPLLEHMEKHNLPLSIHGEIADDTTDVFDRESLFIDRWLEPLVERFPELRITFEHISTKKAVDFVKERARSHHNLAATITPHHLLLNRNDLLGFGLRPHHYCLPLVKREEDRLALVDAAKSGEGCFFLGTDSAPHTRSQKQSSCGCAGVFNAPYAIECVFAALKPQTSSEFACLELFTSENAAAFHNLPLNEERLTLVKKTDPYLTSLPVANTDEEILVFAPPHIPNKTEEGEAEDWQVLRG